MEVQKLNFEKSLPIYTDGIKNMPEPTADEQRAFTAIYAGDDRQEATANDQHTFSADYTSDDKQKVAKNAQHTFSGASDKTNVPNTAKNTEQPKVSSSTSHVDSLFANRITDLTTQKTTPKETKTHQVAPEIKQHQAAPETKQTPIKPTATTVRQESNVRQESPEVLQTKGEQARVVSDPTSQKTTPKETTTQGTTPYQTAPETKPETKQTTINPATTPVRQESNVRQESSEILQTKGEQARVSVPNKNNPEQHKMFSTTSQIDNIFTQRMADPITQTRSAETMQPQFESMTKQTAMNQTPTNIRQESPEILQAKGEQVRTSVLNNNDKDQEQPKMPSPDSLMAGLFGNRMVDSTPLTTPAETAVPQSESVSNINEEMDKLVDRILVADPVQGKQEVRLTLSAGLLKGAEVNIARHADGQLEVHINCMDAPSFQTAVSARQELMDALEAKGEQVRVIVHDNNAGGGNEGDTRRRSQGLQFQAEEYADA